jgi:uncharacterized repeat protein (TIGR01451 family)
MDRVGLNQKYFYFLFFITIIVLLGRLPAVVPERPGIYSKTPLTDTRNTSNMVSRVFSFPLVFEKNTGQFPDANQYISRALGYGLGFSADHVAIILTGAGKLDVPERVNIVFEGASDQLAITGHDRQSSVSHYFKGGAGNNYETYSAPHFAGVRYHQIYDGIDAIFYGKQKNLEFDFIVSPGASAGSIKLKIDGAQKIELAENGDLLINTNNGLLRKQAPIAYQEKADTRHYVDARFQLDDGNRVSFVVGDYDTSIPLTIDPVLSFSSFLGGIKFDIAYAVTTDSDGDIYIAGNTQSDNFPVTTGAFQEDIAIPDVGSGDNDAFVTKIDADGNGIIFSSFLGGDGNDFVYGIDVDDDKDIYVVGDTLSDDFPTTAGALYDGKKTGGFVTKISASGASLLYSTYFGGAANENPPGFGESGEARAIDVDADGNAYITGVTTSDKFPVTAGALQTSRGGIAGDFDAYVSKLNSTGTALLYSTYLGGSDDELLAGGDTLPGDIVVDAAGSAYVTGYTKSTNFPAASNTIAGESDVYIVKLNPQGTAVDFSRYLGGTGEEEGNGIAIDSNGNVIVVGFTRSDDFPLANAFQNSNASAGKPNPQDMFISKVDNNGDLVFSTYLGGAENTDEASAVVVDEQDNLFVTGFGAPDFPRIEPVTDVEQDKFSSVVVKLDAAGSPVYSTAIARTRQATDLALGNNGEVVVVGATSKNSIPVKNAFQPVSGDQFLADRDAFVLKLEPGVDIKVMLSALQPTVTVNDDVTLKADISNVGANMANSVLFETMLPGSMTFVSASPSCAESSGKVSCNLNSLAAGANTTIDIVATATAEGVQAISGVVTSDESDVNDADNTSALDITVNPVSSGGGGTSGSTSGDTGGGGGGGSAMSLPFLMLLILLQGLVQGYRYYAARKG